MSASCPHLAWAGSGCMELTGWPDRPPVAPAAPVLDRLAAVAADLADRSARGGRRVTVDLAVALSARAATLGLTRGGRVSANGSCRLLRTRRGWLACNLARAADRDAVGALVGAAVAGDPWDALAGAAGRLDGRELLATGRALGLAVAWLPDPPAPDDRRPGARLPSSGGSSSAGIAAPVHAGRLGAAVGPRGPAELTVVDLSSLWAGPSCSRLLGLAGARVVKVESESRPDGARYGPPGWWRWLHDGHESRVVDFASPDGRAELRRWLEAADVVIEASRPRALAQLGLAPGSLRLRPGCTWLSITGHGRRGDDAMWVGFGDDASVAGGLVAWDDGGPVFCGDAMADPATGLVAADAVVRSAAAGGGRLLAVDLAGVAGWLAAPAAEACPGPHRTRPSPHGWEAVCGDGPRPHRCGPRPGPVAHAVSLVLRNVALPAAAERGGGRRAPAAGVELRVEAGRITAIAGRVARRAGDVVVDGDGGVVHPGLHDHHVHLHATAAAGRSVDVGPAAVDGPAGLSAALRSAAADSAGGWVRAVGYHESVAGPLDRLALDAIVVDRPVRVQHRSGVLWSLNSAALARLGAASASAPGIERDERGVPTGRLWREDRWVGRQLAALGETGPASDHRRALAAVAAAAAGRGVTGFTDAEVDRPDADLEAFAGLAGEGLIPQRLHLMLRPGTPEAAVAVLPSGGRVTPGPVKVLLDDDRLPPVDGLARLVAASHARRRPVAVHCVTAVQLVVALTAFDEAGTVPGDRLEHAAVVAGDLIGAIRRLGLTVVTQPGLVAARGDSYLRDVDPVDVADLWRAGSLARQGCTVAAGTDAPHGPDDPWLAMATAVSRRTTGGALLGPAEAVDTVTARRWWEGRADAPGHRRRVAVGEPGDLVVVEPGGSGPSAVVVTVVAGAVVHRRGPAPG